MNHDRHLRKRLAVLYAALLLGSGLVLLALADLPLITFGQVQAHVPGGAGTRTVPSRSVTDLPEVLGYSAIALAVLAVASIALGWLVADRALRPLRAITRAARTISASSLGERLSLTDAYTEFRELGDTLNGLFARLEAAFESQRHFVANASHELRTPLAAERTVLQVALADPGASADSLRAACRQVLELGEQQERLVDALLTLAVSQSGLPHREAFDLAAVTARVVAARQADADRLGVRVTTSLDPATVCGDPHLAESLVANLVDNAVRHNVPAGEVRVGTRTGSSGPCLSISNSGPVILPGEIERLLAPFQQLNRERTGRGEGHGLGLAIIAAVAKAHNANLKVTSRPQGGLDITVMFLRSPHQ